MFRFSGRTDRTRFFIGVAIRIALFAASVVGFPFIQFALLNLSSCRSVSGACGAVALLISSAIKPIFFVLFVFSLIGISMRRTRDAGFAPAFGLVIPTLVLADYKFGVFMGAHWSFAFASGVLWLQFPWFLACDAIALVILGLLPPRDPAPSANWLNGRVADLAPFPMWLLATAALLTITAVIITADNPAAGMWNLIFAIGQVTLPTFLIYAAALYGIWGVWQRPGGLAAIILLVTALPFLAYAYAASLILDAHADEAAEISVIKTEKLDHVPRTLVYQADYVSSNFYYLLGVHGISEIIAPGNGRGKMISFTGKRKPDGSLYDSPEVEALPEEHLLLKLGSLSSFSRRNVRYGPSGGPFELRLIAPGRDDLIAVWYQRYNPGIAFPPVLAVNGWLPNQHVMNSTEFAHFLKQFLDQSVSKAMDASLSR